MEYGCVFVVVTVVKRRKFSQMDVVQGRKFWAFFTNFVVSFWDLMLVSSSYFKERERKKRPKLKKFCKFKDGNFILIINLGGSIEENNNYFLNFF